MPWLAFIIFMIVMVAFDAGLFHSKQQPKIMTRANALLWTGIWIGLSVIFGMIIWVWQGSQPALEFFSGYIIEKSLSLDNIFVFIVIFSHFSIPPRYQHRILIYGVLSAVVLRGLFIGLGISLIQTFDWIFYVFGIILIFTSIKMYKTNDANHHNDMADNKILIWLRRYVPVTSQLHGQSFMIKSDGKWLATPLLLVLIFIELSDVLFAFDSIPAIFAITQDPFIVFTSNIFAIMGLRALYFVVIDSMKSIHYLNYGIGTILLFIGIKLMLFKIYHFSIPASLGIISGILVMTFTASHLKNKSIAIKKN